MLESISIYKTKTEDIFVLDEKKDKPTQVFEPTQYSDIANYSGILKIPISY